MDGRDWSEEEARWAGEPRDNEQSVASVSADECAATYRLGIHQAMHLALELIEDAKTLNVAQQRLTRAALKAGRLLGIDEVDGAAMLAQVDLAARKD